MVDLLHDLVVLALPALCPPGLPPLRSLFLGGLALARRVWWLNGDGCVCGVVEEGGGEVVLLVVGVPAAGALDAEGRPDGLPKVGAGGRGEGRRGRLLLALCLEAALREGDRRVLHPGGRVDRGEVECAVLLCASHQLYFTVKNKYNRSALHFRPLPNLNFDCLAYNQPVRL